MSWVSKGLKKLGKGVKKVGKQVGKAWEKVDDFALPAIGFALGGPGGAALGAAAARGIGDGKFNAGETLKAGVKGYALGSVGQAAGLTGGQGLKTLGSSAVKSLANPVATGGNIIKSQLGMAPSAAGGGGAPSLLNANISADGVIPAAGGMVSRAASAGGGGGAWDMLKNAGSFALKNKDLLLGGLAGYEGYQSDKQADAMRKKQYDLAMQNWNTTAPLRTQGQAQMLDQSLEQMPYARNKYNPFA